jgi:hypothetical protein
VLEFNGGERAYHSSRTLGMSLISMMCAAGAALSIVFKRHMSMMQTGLDRLASESVWRERLRGRRVALLGHPASVDDQLTHSLDVLGRIPSINLTAAFGPQHGLKGDQQDNMMETPDDRDERRGIPGLQSYGRSVSPRTRCWTPSTCYSLTSRIWMSDLYLSDDIALRAGGSGPNGKDGVGAQSAESGWSTH